MEIIIKNRRQISLTGGLLSGLTSLSLERICLRSSRIRPDQSERAATSPNMPLKLRIFLIPKRSRSRHRNRLMHRKIFTRSEICIACCQIISRRKGTYFQRPFSTRHLRNPTKIKSGFTLIWSALASVSFKIRQRWC